MARANAASRASARRWAARRPANEAGARAGEFRGVMPRASLAMERHAMTVVIPVR
jgi:hypothetical protein